ncbi:MAG TPA: hypothetical protein DEO70_03450 [Bacteroidales bacterium]|nr:MAG: hypothetical protein A2X11_01565 [Bacteroidetes bacterium GWE2_42_24]OFY29745.1 MAG: hypothetical protein A2X09_01610 [Bacteroidetes bacterium GWF2_43_11]HBZ65868.1 hypothetical protein [Bacteroidales bacterium]
MPHRQADIRIAPIDHCGTKPDSDVTHSNRMGFVNDNWVSQGVKCLGLNQGNNADDQILSEGQEVKLEPEAHQYLRAQIAGVADARYIQELPRHKSIKTNEIYTHMSEKSIQRIDTPHDA